MHKVIQPITSKLPKLPTQHVQSLSQTIDPPQVARLEPTFKDSQAPSLIEPRRACAGTSLSSRSRRSPTTCRTHPSSSRTIPTCSSSSSYRTTRQRSKFLSSRRCQGIKARPRISSSSRCKLECRSVAKNWLHLLAARRI